MMFEKSLKSIEEDPTDEGQLRAFLSLVGQLPSAAEKADALAHLAEVLTPSNLLGALEHIEAAFRLSPEHQKVLGVLTTIFEKRGRKEALLKIKAFARKKGPESARPPADVPRPGKREPTLATTPKPSKSLLSGRSDNAIDKDISKVFPKVAASPAKKNQEIFRDFVLEARLPENVLEFAPEFVSSLLGLIHFVFYLRHTRKVTLGEFARSTKILLLLIDDSPLDSLASIRFNELIRPVSRPPTSRFRG